ncbi:cation transporter [Carboxylicivirga sp. N1Y90]|uniref:cation transporter n=1 Tax=Carboxylicivirga fragile TaxID=3417571 RepID=UPI003D337F6E|nr:heavy-metal-associated domain-containing protein [Marinilabiliaceae bacterium N1Y90]
MRILNLLFVLATVAVSCQSKKADSSSEVKEAVVVNAVEVVLNVEGMTCEGCENTVEVGLTKLEGVASVEADHTTGLTKIQVDTAMVSKTKLAETVKKFGYAVK